MLDALLPFYERELSMFRQLAGEFAARNPKIARRLALERDQCEDPHVERLVQAFAFMAARIHRRLDDDFPEISEAFLQVLYPHYTRPFPSASILHFLTEAGKAEITGRYTIARHHSVLGPPVNGIRCNFRTCYEVDLWPLKVSSVRLELAQNSEHLRRKTSAEAAITIELTTLAGLDFASLPLDKLRFFLDGDPGLMHLLYELLFLEACEVRLSDGTEDPRYTVRRGKDVIRPVGFAPDEGMLDYDARSPMGFRLLSEVFAFPDKFMFFDVAGLDAPQLRHPGCKLQIQIMLSNYGDSERHSRLVEQLSVNHFKLGCTPIVNLFRHAAEPIRLTHLKSAYPVHIDHRRQDAYEVYSIDSVIHNEGKEGSAKNTPVQPFYSLNHQTLDERTRFYWYASREPSSKPQDRGSHVKLSMVDLNFQPVRCDTEILSLDLTCTNRDLPESIPFGGGRVGQIEDFTLPNHSVVKQSRLLRKPTAVIRPPDKRGYQWRLISHLTLNQISVVAHGKEPMQEVLGLYNLTESTLAERQIQGIVAVESEPSVARITGGAFSSFVRGVDVSVTFDEGFYTGSNLFLFASVIEKYLAQCCPPNSFVRFHMFTRQREGEVAQWPPRVGDTVLI